MYCRTCPNPVSQEKNGQGGYEIGIVRWFSTIEPWDVQVIICASCFKKLEKTLGLSEFEVKRINEQTPNEKTTPQKEA